MEFHEDVLFSVILSWEGQLNKSALEPILIKALCWVKVKMIRKDLWSLQVPKKNIKAEVYKQKLWVHTWKSNSVWGSQGKHGSEQTACDVGTPTQWLQQGQWRTWHIIGKGHSLKSFPNGSSQGWHEITPICINL